MYDELNIVKTSKAFKGNESFKSVYENDLAYLVHVSDKKFENWMDLLLVTDENKLHHAYIRDFNKFMFNKTKNKNKRHFCRYSLQCFKWNVLMEHKKVCLKINGNQRVKLRSSIKLENYFKQLAVLFKIYVDLESVLK